MEPGHLGRLARRSPSLPKFRDDIHWKTYLQDAALVNFKIINLPGLIFHKQELTSYWFF